MRRAQLNELRVTVSEAALSRLLARANEPFAILTAYRSNYSKDQNILRSRELRTELNKYKMGVHQLIGHWRECQDPKIPYEQCPEHLLNDVVERSYFVQKPPDMPLEQFEELTVFFGSYFEQDSVILYDGSTVWNIDCLSGKRNNIGTDISPEQLGKAYSQHIRKSSIPFVFEGLEVPTSNIGRMGWQARGLVVPPSDDSQRDLRAESVN
jgi:hypothetical protein